MNDDVDAPLTGSGQATHNYKTFGDYGVTPPKPWAEEFVSWYGCAHVLTFCLFALTCFCHA